MNAVDFCQLVESSLGWEAPNLPAWHRYRVEAAKVNKKIATNPALYTWDNLVLAVELLRRERKSRSPLGVFSHVQRALDLALDEEHDVEEEIRRVVALEVSLGDPSGWAGRFSRTTGHYRRLALDEWRSSVR